MTYGGKTFCPALDEERLNEQTIRVYRAMNDGEWRTLEEISVMTGDPEASISARLRDLRKPEFGEFVVDKRRRGLPSAGLWEYKLAPPGSPCSYSPPAAKKPKNPFVEGMKRAAEVFGAADPAFKNSTAARALRREIEKVARR